jgi:hypothetical protein
VNHLQIEIVGTRPLLMHAVDRALDHRDPARQEIKAITAKKTKKTEADMDRLEELEFHMSLYTDGEGGVVMPEDNLLAMVRDSHKVVRKGKDVVAGVVIDGDAPLLNSAGRQYKDPDALWMADGGNRHRSARAVRVQSSRVRRMRPIFRDWKLTFGMHFLPTEINRDDLIKYIERGGVFVGLGDNRPRCGAFVVTAVDGKKTDAGRELAEVA